MPQRYERFIPHHQRQKQPDYSNSPKLPEMPRVVKMDGIDKVIEEITPEIESSKLSENYVTTSGQ